VEVTFSGEYTLEGITWLLDKTLPGSEITAEFSNGEVSGSAGCNTYRGSYRSTLAANCKHHRVLPAGHDEDGL
jgi:hypothetical protein